MHQLLAVVLLTSSSTFAADPLPSWNDTAPRRAIVSFVERVTKDGSPEFVPLTERIAVFDNDGTLWCEQPMYVQMAFVLDRVKQEADRHPEWKDKQPFKAVLEDDLQAVAKSGEAGLVELVTATHAGMTTEEFDTIVKSWLASARHPKFQRPYTECVYQPMLELLQFLRKHGFKTYIVSGGGIEFMRPWAETVYGIPPEQVIGSMGRLSYELVDGKTVIKKLPGIDLVDDKAGKPVGIQKFIGRRPLMAFGNSDGDFEMLEWTTARPGPSFGLIVHHTDADREFAYDRNSSFGRLDLGLEEGPRRGWIIVDMQRDWSKVFTR